MAHVECGPPRGDAGVCRWWRPPPQSRLRRLLLLLFVEFQFADIVSTNSALAVPGSWEVNPLMALSQAKLGAAWWLPKAAAVALCCLAAPVLRRSWPIIVAVSYYAVIVGGNLAQL